MLRGGGQEGLSLNESHPPTQMRQHRRLVARASADLEHVGTVSEAGGRGHRGDDEGLADMLVAGDRQLHIVMGHEMKTFRHEQTAINGANRRQHAFVLNALVAQPIDQTVPDG